MIRAAVLLLTSFADVSSAQGVTRTLDTWMEPPPVLGRPSTVTVRAVDRETRVSVNGTVTIYGARDTTRVSTNRRFTYVFRCARTRHGEVTSTECERIIVSAPGYKTEILSYAGNVHPQRP